MSPAGTHLRVGSYNVRTSKAWDGRHRWRRRRDACAAAVRALDAGVVGLQEVRPDQLDFLRGAFPDAAFAGDGRDADGGGEHVSVLVAPGWTVESSETRWLSPTPTVAGSTGFGAHLPRTATFVRLRRGAVRIGVANTHLDHEHDATRVGQAELLARWLTSEIAADPQRGWVLTGDLNTDPGSAPLQILAGAGFADSLPADAGGTEHGFTGSTTRRRIDYVLAGPGVHVLDAHVSYEKPDGRLPSDHWPVVAELQVCGIRAAARSHRAG